jgi:type II secretory pathway pseudopilin PulG
MIKGTNLAGQSGYTLIELLLYVIILGSLLATASLYFATSTESRVKNQSINEVNQQGTLAMERITQTIRNADSITSPVTGATDDSLTLVVPTGAQSPTIFDLGGPGGGGGGPAILGYDQDGGTTSELNANTITATKFVASFSGTVTALHARVGPVGVSPNDRAQMAVYSGVTPTTLLANSVTKILTANSWNTFTITSFAITSGETYWLSYNTNALSSTDNNLRYHTGTTSQSRTVGQAYGSWPASWSGFTQNLEFSMYADVTTAATSGTILQVKEGAPAAVYLTNDKVEISDLTFKNLTRSGTPGVVQVSFTVSRTNPSNRNEYDYQKTFTSSAALR